MQDAVEKLVELGPLPSEDGPYPPELYDQYATLINNELKVPLSIEEANALITLLGDDTCFGVAWSLIHKIETAKGYSIPDAMQGKEMIQQMLARIDNTFE